METLEIDQTMAEVGIVDVEEPDDMPLVPSVSTSHDLD